MPLLAQLVIILTTALIGGLVAYKLKFPLILGYIITGVLIAWVSNVFLQKTQTITAASDIGIVFLMFTLGLQFSLSKLAGFGKVIFLGSILQIVLTAGFGILLLPWFGFSPFLALFLGTAFSLSSTAVVVKIFSDKGEEDSLSAEIATGWLLVQDLATLPLMIFLPSLAKALSSGSGALWGTLVLSKSIAVSLGMLFVLFFVGRKIIPFFLQKIVATKSRELLLVAVVCVCLSCAYIASFFGLSLSLGAFFAGFLIATTPIHQAVFSEVRPLRDIFSILFFVSLGMLLPASFFISNIGIILLLTLVVLGIKFILSATLVLALGYHTKTAWKVGLSIANVGEFAFVLASISFAQGTLPEYVYYIILSVTTASLAISTPLLSHADGIYRRGRKILIQVIPKSAKVFAKLDRKMDNEIFTLTNHVIVLGHGRVGSQITKALTLAKIPYLVVEYNYRIVSYLRSIGVPSIYGDPAEIDVLSFTNISQSRGLVVTIADSRTQYEVISHCRSISPTIPIVCRTHHESEREYLQSLGVESIVQPEFEAAVAMSESLLNFLHVDKKDIQLHIDVLKKEYGHHAS